MATRRTLQNNSWIRTLPQETRAVFREHLERVVAEIETAHFSANGLDFHNASARVENRLLALHAILDRDEIGKAAIDGLQKQLKAVFPASVADEPGFDLFLDSCRRLLTDLQPATAGPTAATAAKDCTHSPDFRSVRWSGQPFTFTKNQAACVMILWQAWQQGTPERGGLDVVIEADVRQTRLIDVFRSKDKDSGKRKMHTAWGTMIVPGTKGAYRLANPNNAPKKSSRKGPRKNHR